MPRSNGRLKACIYFFIQQIIATSLASWSIENIGAKAYLGFDQ